MRLNLRSNTTPTLFPFLAALVAVTMCGITGFAAAQTTREEKNSAGVYRIKAPSMYSLGVTGVGVTVAIVDTGLLTTHPEFTGRVLTGYNAFTGTTNVTDGDGHGTHVTGIIGAGRGNPSTSGMFGVAYNVFLLPIKSLDDRGMGTSASVANGIQYAVNQRNSTLVAPALKPFAINLSLGSSSPSTTIETALRNAVGSGMVVAAAAGNSGGSSPGWPARYAKETWANGQIIAVGAVDANNVIASWSNRAGDTQSFYLVAPGTSIYSTYSQLNRKTKQYDPIYATLSGTSMATPYVTGAVALIKSGWSYLAAPQITSILFTSATDLGAPGVDAIYGRGMLNLERALQPLGSFGAPVSSGSTVPLTGTSVTSSTATGSAVRAAGRAGLMQVAAFDSYGRDYQVDLSPTVRRAPSTANSLAGMLSAVDTASEVRHSRNGTTLRLSYRSEATRLALGEQSGFGAGKDGYAMSAVDASGREMVFGLSGMGTNAFGLAGELARLGESPFAPQLANPYFSLVPQHVHAGIGLPISNSLRVKVGVLASDPRITNSEGVPLVAAGSRNMTLGEVAGRFDAGVWTVGLGRLQESDSVLGTVQTGALGFSGTAGTTVASFGVAVSPVPRLKIGTQYTVGYTDGMANRADSLVTGYTTSRSEAYAAFASLHEPFGKGDRLSITISQPMRAVSGEMQMVVPVTADAQGSPVMQSRAITLRPDGRETRTDLLYMNPINRHANVFLGITVRNQPDHDRTAPRQVTLGTGLRAVF